MTEFRCGEILDAARKVFASNGFENATIEHIAEAAGIAKGTVYLYFRSKRDLYLAAVEQGVAALNDETKRRMDLEITAPEKLRSFIETRVAYFEQNRDFFKIYQSEFGNIFCHPAQMNAAFKDLYYRQAKVLETVLTESMRAGELRAVRSDLAAFTIYDMTRGVIAQRLLGWSSAAAADDVAALFDLIWKGIAP